jgi:hypothetical protein
MGTPIATLLEEENMKLLHVRFARAGSLLYMVDAVVMTGVAQKALPYEILDLPEIVGRYAGQR